MRVVMRTWQRLAAMFLAFAAFPPATPAQRVPEGQRFPGQRVPQPGGVRVTAILPVTMEVVQACTVSASDLVFGAYVSDSKMPVRGQTAISLNCGVGVTVEVSLDAGQGLGGRTERRQMRQESGTDRMDYGLYQDPGRKVHWGDRSGVDTVELHATGLNQTVNVYGEIPGGQRVRDGIYSDMITVTLHY